MDVVLFPTRFSRINSTRKNRYYGSSIYTGEYYKSQAASSEKGMKKIKKGKWLVVPELVVYITQKSSRGCLAV